LYNKAFSAYKKLLEPFSVIQQAAEKLYKVCSYIAKEYFGQKANI
jgi:hypothetical protein